MANYILIKENNILKLKKKIEQHKNKKIVLSSSSEETDRKALEKERIDVYLINQKERKDKKKQRDSGLNEYLSKLLKKKNIRLGIDLDELLSQSKKEKAKLLARIQQNSNLIKSKEIPFSVLYSKKNEKHKKEVNALLQLISVPTKAIKQTEYINKSEIEE